MNSLHKARTQRGKTIMYAMYAHTHTQQWFLDHQNRIVDLVHWQLGQGVIISHDHLVSMSLSTSTTHIHKPHSRSNPYLDRGKLPAISIPKIHCTHFHFFISRFRERKTASLRSWGWMDSSEMWWWFRIYNKNHSLSFTFPILFSNEIHHFP